MIEIRYAKSQTGLDNMFDFLHISDYIPLPLTEQRNEGTELKFYLSLFKRFNIIDSDVTGVAYFWSTYFTCRYEQFIFKMIYDNDYDLVSFAVDKKFIKQRKFIAESIKSLIEKEGLNTEMNANIRIIDLNSDLSSIPETS